MSTDGEVRIDGLDPRRTGKQAFTRISGRRRNHSWLVSSKVMFSSAQHQYASRVVAHSGWRFHIWKTKSESASENVARAEETTRWQRRKWQM